jgi:uncharacterized protein
MILGRRDQPGLLRRLAGWLWPRAGWRRAGSYLLMRLRRLSGTPHAIAAGLATGVAVSLTPFLGLHIVLALGLAWLTGGNLLAAGLGTLVSNPWTLPLIWASTYRLGCLLLGRAPHGLHLLADLHAKALLGEVGLLLWPMTVGAAPLAAAAWVATYLLTVRAVAAVREERRHRLERRPASARPERPTPARERGRVLSRRPEPAHAPAAPLHQCQEPPSRPGTPR